MRLLGKKKAVSYQAQDSLNAIMRQKRGGMSSVRPGGGGNKAGRKMSSEYNGGDAQASPQGTESGTSIFDPVLCEIAYTWFAPKDGLVLDPFAGGSVRGIVASKLGRQYIGHELSGRQVEANRLQADEICGGETMTTQPPPDNTPEITPVELIDGVYFKRDDSFCIGGGKGGKVRTCWKLAQGADGLVTAGSRSSPQVNIVAQIAKKLGIPCRVHTPQGELSEEVLMAQAAGAKVMQHKAGYNNVIIARAREDAKKTCFTEIPFGMECKEAVTETSKQVENIPDKVKRIIVPVGSGMSLSGILHGLKKTKKNIPVLGVVAGADPEKRLDKYAPSDWRNMVELVPAGMDYDKQPKITEFKGVQLDPIYEAKCIRFIEEGDLMWVVGLRASEAQNTTSAIMPEWVVGDSMKIDKTCADVQADFLFSCPPYADLEVYSDDPADISNMDYADFRTAYFEIIKKSCALLKDDRFACFVVGEVRDKKGNYYNLVGDTIEAFRAAGLEYYNEAILVTAIGSLPIRAGRAFAAGRKLGKTHQNMLVFIKGNSKKATQACGDVDVYIQEEE